jgi:hypothetical protein
MARYVPRLGVFLIPLALSVGMVGCESPAPATPEIRDWYDLHAIRNNPAGTYVLMNDLDRTAPGYEQLAGPIANQGRGWQPIGTSDEPFTGTFCGQGYGISDMFINRPDGSAVGLFGAVNEGGAIQNIKVLGAAVTGEWAVGALVGENRGGVYNSYSGGIVSGEDCVGGLVGANGGAVYNSDAAVTVAGRWDVGGLVGCSDSRGVVSNSYSVGSVTGEWAVGGLVGGNWGGTVSRSYSISGVVGLDYVGGLVGDNQGTVTDSYATGDVSGEWHIGGLAGYSRGNVGSSYSIGRVTGSMWVGGLVGTNRDGTVSNCFWDTANSGMEESDGGISKTTAEMEDISTFLAVGWDVTTVTPGVADPTYTWNMVGGETYPFLSWQRVS